MRRFIFTASALALAALLMSTPSTFALHEEAHQLGIAAWAINGEPVPDREGRLDGTVGGALPEVHTGDRVEYLVRVVDQSEALSIQLAFNHPGHAYVLGSASGGSCDAPAAAAPGIFHQDCVVAVDDDGSGNLLLTYEITEPSDDPCDGSAGEPVTATLIVTQPQRAVSDLHVCAAVAPAPAPPPSPTPSSVAPLPDTALADGSDRHPSRGVGLAALIVLLGGATLLARRG